VALPLQKVGMVTDAAWEDFTGDRRKELVVVGEWMPITIFSYNAQQKKFSATPISHSSGWWNCIKAADVDGDGDMDFVAGNLGLNSKIRGDSARPAKLYVNDFDKTAERSALFLFTKAMEKNMHITCART
jgi:hypothetical protein